MPAASVALRAAVHAALKMDTALAAVLGGARVHDEVPREAAFPYVTLGDAVLTDISTDDGEVQEHRLELHAWLRQGTEWSCAVDCDLAGWRVVVSATESGLVYLVDRR